MPTTWRRAPAGLVSGPRMLKTVRTPISRRGPMAWRMARWRRGAKRKPILASRMQRATVSTSASRLTPSSFKTSAEPLEEETARLPCLATLTPMPAATSAAVVDMLKVEASSPPVPQVSTTVPAASTCTAISRMTRAKPVISSTVSPLILSAMRKPAICAGVASPDMMTRIASAASASLRLSPSTARFRYPLSIRRHRLLPQQSRAAPRDDDMRDRLQAGGARVACR